MEIKVLGSGCANCVELEKRTRDALAMMELEAEVVKVTDFADIAAYGVMTTPALVVDDDVVMSGRVPGVAEIQQLLAPPA